MSANHPQSASAAQRRRRALIWAVRLHEPLSPRRQLLLERWRASPANRQALDEALASWRELGHLQPVAMPDAAVLAADRYDGSVPIAVWLDRESIAQSADSGARPMPALQTQKPARVSVAPRAALPAWGIAACAAILVVGMAVAAMLWHTYSGQTIETGAGEWQQVQMVDGTVVKVGPLTELEVHLRSDERHIELKRGEAYFDVAKDPSRPFIVSTELMDARATGTAFAVSRWDGLTTVTVQEGEVTVSRPAAPGLAIDHPDNTLKLGANEQATASGQWPLSKSRVDIESALASLDGKLVLYAAVPIADVARELNRRNRLQIVIDDAAIASKPISGVFRADDPEAFAAFVARMMDVAISRESPSVLRLQASPASRAKEPQP